MLGVEMIAFEPMVTALTLYNSFACSSCTSSLFLPAQRRERV
jgi:hypothetical protein